MKIELVNVLENVTKICFLDYGELFYPIDYEEDNDIYLKVQSYDSNLKLGNYECIDLITNCSVIFNSNTDVVKLKGKLIIKNPNLNICLPKKEEENEN